jgi:ribonuclease T1
MLARLLPLLLLAFAALLPVAQAREAPVRELRDVAVSQLPREARETLVLIRRGGPFPYSKDGTVFFNRERLLPMQPRGYYREYTVPTPGARDRGARRIVAGGDPRWSGEYYYTRDHYRSFRRIRE